MRFIFFVVIACILFSSCSLPIKESAVPQPVKNAFQQMFPKVDRVRWMRHGRNAFLAKVWIKNEISKAIFSQEGKFLEEETEIKSTALPQPVMQFIFANYKNEKIEEATKIKKADGSVIYEAEIGNKDIYITADGRSAPPKVSP